MILHFPHIDICGLVSLTALNNFSVCFLPANGGKLGAQFFYFALLLIQPRFGHCNFFAHGNGFGKRADVTFKGCTEDAVGGQNIGGEIKQRFSGKC